MLWAADGEEQGGSAAGARGPSERVWPMLIWKNDPPHHDGPWALEGAVTTADLTGLSSQPPTASSFIGQFLCGTVLLMSL